MQWVPWLEVAVHIRSPIANMCAVGGTADPPPSQPTTKGPNPWPIDAATM